MICYNYQKRGEKVISKIIKKVELYYRNENDNLVSDLSSIESFCGHNSSGDRFVGVYIILEGRMIQMKKIVMFVLIFTILVVSLTACEATGSSQDIVSTQEVADNLAISQPTPTDINFSLERYNLMRRAYWVNGQREKANSIICEVPKPFGYIILFAGNAPVSRFIVDGKVSSLNSFLTPSAYDEYVTQGGVKTIELSDVDGSYGENDNGIFFFTIDGNYVEWTGEYLYSDIPIEIDNPIVSYKEVP